MAGCKALEKLAGDKDADAAEAAKASIAAVAAWKESVDAEIIRLRTAGDVFNAGEMAAAMVACWRSGPIWSRVTWVRLYSPWIS